MDRPESQSSGTDDPSSGAHTTSLGVFRPPTRKQQLRFSMVALRIRLALLTLLVLLPAWLLLASRLPLEDEPGVPWYLTNLALLEGAGFVTLVLVYVCCRFLVVRRIGILLEDAERATAREQVRAAEILKELDRTRQSLRRMSKKLDQEETRLRIFQDEYKMVVEEVPAVFYLGRDDLMASRAYVSVQSERYFGYTPKEWTSDPQLWSRCLHPADRTRVLSEYARCMATGETFDVEYRLSPKSGGERWVRDIGQPVAQSGGLQMRGFIIDVSDRKQVEDRLRDEKNFADTVLDTAGVLVVVLDPDGRITRFNRACEMATGFDAAEATGRILWEAFILTEEIDRVRASFGELRAGRRSRPYESSLKTKHGGPRRISWSNTTLRDAEGRVTQVIATGIDVTEHRQLQEQLRHDALHDALTGLANRVLFVDRLRQCIRRAKRRKDRRFAVLFMDLDRFKLVNDSLGHLVGDQLLTETARRLERCVRPGDTVARHGGDEFTVLLEDVRTVSDALHVSERIKKLWETPINLNGQEIYATSSIGIAVSKPEYSKPEEILRDADTAMYRAKTLGRARHEVFDSAMHAHAVEQLRVETDLRRGLERGEFALHYQPIVELETRGITGFEALVRWNHPERGLVPPFEFVRVAEETGLIVPLGRWIMKEACRQLKEWHDLHPGSRVSVSVNLSPKQFVQPDLVGEIRAVLEETGLSTDALNLEITESVLMDNTDSAVEALAGIRKLGAKVYLDDFGTGYSSLSYLHRFPVDALKIDRSFVMSMGKEGDDGNEIVRTIISLATSLRKKVIAEGIETEDQLRELRQLNCGYGQGHLFSGAVPGERAAALVARA